MEGKQEDDHDIFDHFCGYLHDQGALQRDHIDHS